MRTKSSKLAETMTFEKFGSASLIVGPNKVLFKRHIQQPLQKLYEAHTEGFWCAVLALSFGLVIGSRL